MDVLVAWCFGTAAPATVLLHGAHHSLTVGGVAGVAWLLAPEAAVDHARRLVGGVRAESATRWAALAVVGSAAAAIIHLLVVPGHLRAEAGPWLAPGFVVVAVAQGAWAYAVARGADDLPGLRGDRLLVAGVAIHAGSLLVWALTRTVGLPDALFPGGTAVVGIPDLAVVVWQLLALVAAAVLLRDRRRPGSHPPAPLLAWSAWPPVPRLVAAVAGAGLAALTAFGGLV